MTNSILEHCNLGKSDKEDCIAYISTPFTIKHTQSWVNVTFVCMTDPTEPCLIVNENMNLKVLKSAVSETSTFSEFVVLDKYSSLYLGNSTIPCIKINSQIIVGRYKNHISIENTEFSGIEKCYCIEMNNGILFLLKSSLSLCSPEKVVQQISVIL